MTNATNTKENQPLSTYQELPNSTAGRAVHPTRRQIIRQQIGEFLGEAKSLLKMKNLAKGGAAVGGAALLSGGAPSVATGQEIRTDNRVNQPIFDSKTGEFRIPVREDTEPDKDFSADHKADNGSQEQQGARVDFKSETRKEPERLAIKHMIFDQGWGSKDQEVLRRAGELIEFTINDGLDADGIFEETATWLLNNNRNGVTTITNTTYPSNSGIGYSSVLTVVALTTGDIERIVNGSYIAGNPAEPAYKELLHTDVGVGIVQYLIDAPGKPGVKLLVNRFVVKADQTDTFNGTNMVDLAMAVRKAQAFENKLAETINKGITQTLVIKGVLFDVNFQNETTRDIGDVVYENLDSVKQRDDLGYFRLSESTQRGLDLNRKLRGQ